MLNYTKTRYTEALLKLFPQLEMPARGALIRSRPVILEPMQNIRVDAPNDVIGGVTREVTNRRGIIEDMPVDGGTASVIGKMPVAETFGFSNDIRAASQGRAVWNTENAGFEMLPPSLFEENSRGNPRKERPQG